MSLPSSHASGPLIAALNFSHFETAYCLVGHTHQPIIYEQIDGSFAEFYALVEQREGHLKPIAERLDLIVKESKELEGILSSAGK